MEYFSKISITRFIITVIFFVICTTSLLFISTQYNSFKEDIEKLKEDYIKTQKELLQKEIKSGVDYICYKKNTTKERLKKELKTKVNQAHTISLSIYNKYKNKKTGQEIIDMIKTALRDIRFFGGRGYFFINQLNSRSVLHPIFPNLENKYFFNNFTDSKGRKIIKEEFNKVLKKGDEGYVKYEYYRPNSDILAMKYGYIKKIKPLNLYIGTAEYIDDFEKIVKKEIFDRVGKIRFGKDGYLFIDNYKGIILMHPMKPEIVGENLTEYRDINGKYVIKELIKAAKKTRR